MFRSAKTVVAGGLAVALGLTLAVSGPVSSLERFEDVVGDAVGESPEIIAVIIDDPENMPVLAITVEFASEPPLGTDEETWTDAVLVGLLVDPEVDSEGRPVNLVARDDFDADYVIGSHGVTLSETLDEGAHLVAPDGDLYWFVVDLAVDGPMVTWRVDRKLIGDPEAVAIQVLAGVERADATEEEYDIFPAEGEPHAMYVLSETDR